MASVNDDMRSYYRNTVSQETKADFGSLGASQSIGADVAVIDNPGASGGRGWYKIWGHGRHTQPDGLRLLIGATEKFQISSVGATNVYFGPYLVEITDDTTDIIVELAVATGVGEAASATVYAKRMADS